MQINTKKTQQGWRMKEKEQQPSKSVVFYRKVAMSEFQTIVAAYLRFQALDEHLVHFTCKNQ